MPTLVDTPKTYFLETLSRLQKQLAAAIVTRDLTHTIETIAGADVAYDTDYAYAAICVWSLRERKITEQVTHSCRIKFRYISGYLCFREGPPLLEAAALLKNRPDCFIFDAHGILHPRRMGLATFMGVMLKTPTIGCAKSLLIGTYKKVQNNRASMSAIRYQNKTMGKAVRTRTGVRPVYVSSGWGISVKNAVEIVLKAATYRIPEPLRFAHTCARRMRDHVR